MKVKEVFVITGQAVFWSSALVMLLLIDIVATIATYFHFKMTNSSFIGLELLFSATIVLNIFLAIDIRKLLKEKTERKFISKWVYLIAIIILAVSLFLLNQN